MRGQMFSIIQRLTNEIFIESNRSMDILQGILVILAWYQNHCMVHTQLNNLLHLAQALLADLGLNKSPEIQERSSVMLLNPPQPHQRTNEEKRAILGVWFLSSSVMIGLQKAFPMRFSKYFKQCLQDLESNPDSELDALLVHLVKIQQLTEQIYNWASKEDEDEDIAGFPRAPASAYQAAFYSDIIRMQGSLPHNLRDNELLRAYFAFTMLHLNEPPPIDAALLEKLADSLTDVNSSKRSALDVFYRAHSALQGFFESWFDIPTHIYPAMPIFVLMQVVYSITMLARWAKILGPGRSSRRWNTPADILTSQKVVWDPSATRPAAPTPIFGADNSSTSTSKRGTVETWTTARPSTATGLSQAAIRLAKLPPPITHPSQIPASQFREAADPNIPRAVASLKAKLLAQPGLNLDIIGILARLSQRFEQVHKELTEEGGRGAWHNDVWYLCAKKMLITRAKLEKWAEIIRLGGMSAATPADEAAGQPHEKGETQMDDADVTVAETQATPGQQPLYQDGHDALAAFQRQIETAGEGILPPELMDDAWQYGDAWTDGMFDQLDPSLWVNDGDGWSMALLGQDFLRQENK